MAAQILPHPLVDAVGKTATAARVWLAGARVLGDARLDQRQAVVWSAALGAILEPLRHALAADQDSAQADRCALHRGMAMLTIAEQALDGLMVDGEAGLSASDLRSTVEAGVGLLLQAFPRRHSEPMRPELRIVT